MKCLISGFEPFGNEATNPSWDAICRLPDQVGKMELIKTEIPTVFGECFIKIQEAIATHKPDFIVCVGQAGGSAAMRVEKIAINLMDARIPDNAGNQPIDQPIIEDGATAYFSTLPVRNMVMAMRDAGIPAELSYSAGTFVCNDVMYRLLAHTKDNTCLAGFIHVPYACHQVIQKGSNMASMDLTTMTKGLVLALETIAMVGISSIVNHPQQSLGTIE